MTGCATRSATLEHIISDERFSVFIGQSSYCPVPLTAVTVWLVIHCLLYWWFSIRPSSCVCALESLVSKEGASCGGQSAAEPESTLLKPV